MIVFIYGGLSFAQAKNDNVTLQTNFSTLEERITKLETTLEENKTVTSKLQENVNNQQEEIGKYQKQVVYYQKLARDAKEKIEALEEQNSEVKENTSIQDNQPTEQKTVTTDPQPTKPVEVKTIVVTAPAPVLNQAIITVEGIGSYKVGVKKNETAYSSLVRTGSKNGFSVQSTNWGGNLGYSVDGINGPAPYGKYWAFYYNGKFSQVGASNQKLKNNDAIFWRLESWL